MTGYAIERAAPPVPVLGSEKSKERIAMEALNVGDAFLIPVRDRVRSARRTRYELLPKEFTVRLVEGKGWQVRRIK